MLVALVVLGFGLWLSNPDFLSHYNLFNLTRQVSMLGVLAVGITFVIVAGGIDLSLGSIIGLTGVLIAKFWAMGQPIAKGGSLSLNNPTFRSLAAGPFRYGEAPLLPWALVIFLVIVLIAAFV